MVTERGNVYEQKGRNMGYRLILASASPRRRELLEQIGATFQVMPAKGEEVITKEQPEQAVMELSRQKAEEIAEKIADGIADEDVLVLGADTVVVYEGKILGKPKDESDARAMLSMLNGRTHSVFTGVTVIVMKNGNSQIHSFYEETEVSMYPMTDAQISYYIQTGEPMDKAGAYGIQGKGAVFIEKIHGDYNNVVGLPVAKIFYKMLESGIEIL